MYAYAPYGTQELDESFKEEYNRLIGVDDYYDRSRHKNDLDYITSIPVKHPLLQSIAGVYPLKPAIPTWWNDNIVYRLSDTQLAYQLAHITLEEFQAGLIDDKVWKAFRNSMRANKDDYPQSPKLGGILESAVKRTVLPRYVLQDFNQRSNESTELDLHIAIDPRSFFYMGDGDGWSSCTNYRDGGSMNTIMGNFFDTTRAIAYVLPHGKELGDDEETGEKIRMKARTTIRIMFPLFESTKQHLMVDRCYTSVPGIRDEMVKELYKQFKAISIPYGAMKYSDALQILETDGGMLRSEKFHTPLVAMDTTYPYTDGSSEWVRVSSSNGRDLYTLTADCSSTNVDIELETTPNNWIESLKIG